MSDEPKVLYEWDSGDSWRIRRTDEGLLTADVEVDGTWCEVSPTHADQYALDHILSLAERVRELESDGDTCTPRRTKMSEKQRDEGWSSWPRSPLNWCPECGDEESLRSCPVCDEEACWSCAKDHVCRGAEDE